ncbi:MAG: hypothetical protein K2M54_04480, partial [Muribaculaceae bacterium]|nr:hypothetical protein [Muribaculaceae bacterium]
NKDINHAIDQNYVLPESFFTGVPASPAITINQLKEIHQHETNNTCQDGIQQDSQDSTPDTAAPTVDATSIHDAIKSIGSIIDPKSFKDLRTGLLLLGFGVIAFLFFLCALIEAMAVLCGGALALLGGAKLLTFFFAKRIK